MSSPATPLSSTHPPWSPVPAHAAAPPPASHLGLIVGAAVGIAIVLVLAVLFLSGVVPLGGSGGPSAETFEAAAAQASANASRYPGGPWELLLAGGIAPATPESFQVSDSVFAAFDSGCTTVLDIANGTSVAIGPYAGNLSAGLASNWLFGFLGSGNAVLVILEIHGLAEPVAQLTCPGASAAARLLAPVSGTLSSPAADAAAWGAGGSAFASAHPGSSVEFETAATPSIAGIGPAANWTVIYESCAPSDTSAGATAPALAVTVNAETQAVLKISGETLGCAGLGGLGTTPLASAIS